MRKRGPVCSGIYLTFLPDAELTLLLTLNVKGRYLGDMSLIRLSHH